MCNSCEVLNINGVNCHETGCPDSWMDKKYMCKWCGNDFVLESKNNNREVCSHSCMVAYGGFYCDCEECQKDNDDFYRETDYSGEDNDGFLLEETEED